MRNTLLYAWTAVTSIVQVNVLDIPRAYTGLAEWLACVVFIQQFKRRLPLKKYLPLSALWLAVQVAFLVLTGGLPLYLWLPCMIAAVGLMLAQLMLSCDLDFYTGAYTCVRAFVLAEFMASLQWQIHCFLWPDDNWIWWQRYGLLALIYGGVFLAVALLERRYGGGEASISITSHELLAVAIMGISVFAISNLSFYFEKTPFSGQYASEVLNIRTLVDAVGIALLYAYHVQHREAQTRKELSAMQTILENQYAQYRMSRDSIDMINRKYHDLKHQIAALRAEPDPAVRNQWLDEMEEDIRTYEAQNKTGNSVLDTLLTGKNLYCQKHSIGMTVVADGKHLAFMDIMDICSLFGNALDNAIECELKISDKTKRMIHLTLTAQRHFLLLQVENYCPNVPEFRDGLPVTTKQDPGSHGFGLKSIRYTAAKYGGTTTVRAEDGWFVLKVLFPLPESKEENTPGGGA